MIKRQQAMLYPVGMSIMQLGRSLARTSMLRPWGGS